MIKKQTIVLIVFLGSLLPISAQKNTWSLRIYSGFRGEIIQSLKKQSTSWEHGLSRPQYELNFTYGITDNLSISSGLSYVKYYGRWKMYARDNVLYQSAQIPLFLTYDIPLGKSRFNFFPKMGLKFEILFDKGHDSHWALIMPNIPKRFNVLINPGIGFKYSFSFGLNIFVIGEYNVGSRIMGEALEHDYSYRVVDYHVLKGDYWCAGVGVSYTFKKK